MGAIFETRSPDPDFRFPPRRSFRVCRILSGQAELVEREPGLGEYQWKGEARAEQIGTFLDDASALAHFELVTSREKHGESHAAVFDNDGTTLAYARREQPKAKDK